MKVSQSGLEYVSRERVQIFVERNLMNSIEKLEMLRGFGFSCTHEFHAGFWLIHWSFPRLKLVESGHVVIAKKGKEKNS